MVRVFQFPQFAFANGELGAAFRRAKATGDLLPCMTFQSKVMPCWGFWMLRSLRGVQRSGVHGNNFPIMTSLSRAIDFESLMQFVHQTLRLQPYQQVSHLIYRMPYVSDYVIFFPCELMDDGGVNQMFVCHATCLPYLSTPFIEIYAHITGIQQDSVGGDYIPKAPLQTVMSQEFLESQPTVDDDEYGGAITKVERLLSIPTAAPNDDIGDEEYEDQLMGNDIEDGDYEEENHNDYEREDHYQYDGPHSCVSTAIAKDHPKLDSDIIAGVIAGLVAEKADIPISLVVETVKKARGFTVSYKKALRGKQKAIARVYGSWVALYNKLTGWMAAMQQAIPGTAVSFQTVDMPGDDRVVQFKRFFWAFKPCIDAW
ncbi:uncharacterized protein G2W53_003369 [Senna tora]|uniref:Uncharacterized protein n=1 Tax=Senna tora TaxID=362788 RepID=A0A834X9P0_9FABA|nr:uncharacterized protein G2W53_003369 [Senna tora]